MSTTTREIRISVGLDRRPTSICLYGAATLRNALEQVVVVDKGEQHRLTQECVALREQGSAVRVREGRQIATRPHGFPDRRLPDLASDAPVLLPRLVGRAMATIGHGEALWRWRVQQLAAPGEMTLVEGGLDRRQAAAVHCGR